MTPIPDRIIRDEMPTQLWEEQRSRELRRERVKEIENGALLTKPYGGLWTSTYTPDKKYQSDWLRWKGREDFEVTNRLWVIEPKSNLRIIEIDNLQDLLRLHRAYPDNEYYEFSTIDDYAFDFESISKDYDGLHLTKKGQEETHMSEVGVPDFYGWDCESTLWFDWHFKRVRVITELGAVADD